MKKIIFITLILIISLQALPSYAFNGKNPATLIYNYDTEYDLTSLVHKKFVFCEYLSMNDKGNYVVATLHTTDTIGSGISQLTTWEISLSGTEITEIDHVLFPHECDDDYIRLVNNDYDYNWYLLSLGGDLYSVNIDENGRIPPTYTDKYEAVGDLVNPIKLIDNLIFINRIGLGYNEMNTCHIQGNGNIQIYDTQNGLPFARYFDKFEYSCKLEGYDNNDILYPMWIRTTPNAPWNGEVGEIIIWSVYANDLDPLTDFGDIGQVVGTHTLSYVGEWGSSTPYISYIENNSYVISGLVHDNNGFGGDRDFGIEIIEVIPDTPTHWEIISTGTGYLADTVDNAGRNNFDLISFDNSVGVFYCSDHDVGEIAPTRLQTSMAWNLLSQNLTQNNITDKINLYNEIGTTHTGIDKNSSCRLGDSLLTASIITEASGNQHIRLLITEHHFPPTVDTLYITPLSTNFNSEIDAGYNASGEVEEIGSSNVNQYGFIYAVNDYPEWTDGKTITTGNKPEPFIWTEQILDLAPSEYYGVCAYACNNTGTGYGDTIFNYSLPEYAMPVLRLDFEPIEINTSGTSIAYTLSGTITDNSYINNDVAFTWYDTGTALTITYEFELTGETFVINRESSDIVGNSPNEGGWINSEEKQYAEENPFYLLISALNDITGFGVMNLWYFFWIATMMFAITALYGRLKSPFSAIIGAMLVTCIFWLWGPISMVMLVIQGIIAMFLWYKDSAISFGRT